MKITKVFETINSTGSNAEKMEILKANMNDTIKQIFEDTYDGKRNYGVKKFEINKCGSKTLDKHYTMFHNLLDVLNKRELTGNAAIEAVENMIERFADEDQNILINIMERKLTIGISKNSFAKVVGQDNCTEYKVTLAFPIDKVKNVDPIDGTYYASRKCDGTRCVAFVTKKGSDVDVVFKSRQCKEFTTLDNVKPAIKWLVRNLDDGKYVFDGEGCIVDENGDEHFDWIMKEIKKKDHTIENPCYQIFDFVTLDEFLMKKESAYFEDRLAQMQKMFKGNKFNTIKLLDQEVITSQDDFDRWSKMVEDGGWEGFMLRRNVPFEIDRTKNLLKVKKFYDDEYVVKDIEIDEMTTSIPGKGNVKFTGVKSLIIEHKKNKVNVGSGLTREQRIDWYKHPEKIVGKTITVKYFEETKNKNGTYSLRFPTLKYVYEDGRDC